VSDVELVALARGGDEAAYGELAGAYRKELGAHCYRMLGSLHDAEDALQQSLLGAWQEMGGYDGSTSVRSWLYRISTDTCLRLSSQRPKKVLTSDQVAARQDPGELGAPILEPIWLEPCPDDPEAGYEQRVTVELAFIAALQQIPSTQRAVLILREVLEYSAAEAAVILETSPQSVDNAFQQARKAVDERIPPVSQQAELASLGQDREQQLIDNFATAWEQADADSIGDLLADDARYTMPPLPAWFDGRSAVMRFVTERLFETRWRVRKIRANGQPAFACYSYDPGDHLFRLGAINVLQLRDGKITWISAFLDPAVHHRFAVPETLPS